MIIKEISCNNRKKKKKTFSEPTFRTLLHSGTCSFNNLHLTKVLFLQSEGNIKIQLHNINGCNKIPTVFVSTVFSRGEGKSEERKKRNPHLSSHLSDHATHLPMWSLCFSMPPLWRCVLFLGLPKLHVDLQVTRLLNKSLDDARLSLSQLRFEASAKTCLSNWHESRKKDK